MCTNVIQKIPIRQAVGEHAWTPWVAYPVAEFPVLSGGEGVVIEFLGIKYGGNGWEGKEKEVAKMSQTLCNPRALISGRMGI